MINESASISKNDNLNNIDFSALVHTSQNLSKT